MDKMTLGTWKSTYLTILILFG